MYAKIENGSVLKYPYTISELRQDNPNTSFPKKGLTTETLESFGVYEVSVPDTPDYNDRTHRLQQLDPELENGTWVSKWGVVEKTADEVAEYYAAVSSSRRMYRDNLLAETDWWASSDLTMTAEQTAYRQALRDITSHANWPHLGEADWPTKP
jgi:hypothetical protein